MKKRKGRRRSTPKQVMLQLLHPFPNEDVRRRPTLPHPPECSTIGAVELSYRVRNGTGRFPDAMTAVTRRDQPALDPPTPPQGCRQVPELHLQNHTVDANTSSKKCVDKSSAISTSQLHTLPCFHIWPINPVISWGPLTHKVHGYLILKQASRLDAFSGYPFPT